MGGARSSKRSKPIARWAVLRDLLFSFTTRNPINGANILPTVPSELWINLQSVSSRVAAASFMTQEPFNGRAILVRLVWSDITPDSHRLEQSFSEDGGKTWEPNFIATMKREKEILKTSEVSSPSAAESADVTHDFDFNFGVWKTHIARLEHPLSGSHHWADYDGTSIVSKVWDGRASLFELEASGSAGHIEGVGLRLYNPKSHQWSLNWANSTDGVVTKPMIGEFANGQSQFFDQEEFQGKSILSRNGFSAIKPESSHFEQAFSDDGGKNWEVNWIMTFTR
jgi:hypothetical protein